MGTDRVKQFEDVCHCDKGVVTIDFCSPDHGWPTSKPSWYDYHLDCKECGAKLAIEQRDKKFVYVEKTELTKLKNLSDEASSLGKEIMNDPWVQARISEFIDLLDAQPSMAAAHRLLQSQNLEYYGIGSFRKHWAGGAIWVKKSVSVHNLREILRILRDETNSEVLSSLSKVHELYNLSRVPAPAYGEPIYVLKKK